MSLRFPVPPAIVFSALASLLMACGGSADVKSPFEPPSRTTVFTVDGRLPNGQVQPWTIRVTGEKVVDGRTFDTYQVAIDPEHPYQGLEVWIDKEDENTVTFRGFQEVNVLTRWSGTAPTPCAWTGPRTFPRPSRCPAPSPLSMTPRRGREPRWWNT